MIDVNDTVLCILHLELQCSKNKISKLFNGCFFHRKQPALIADYFDRVEKVVNAGKIGKSTHQNQWIFLANKSKEVVATDFSLKGASGRNILS